jgi:hypothetical protein
MRVINVHERELNASLETAGALIDGLASDKDVLWPSDRWPPMRFVRPLGAGAVGGHGPIRYVVEAYEPGRSIRFRFTKPDGFRGNHRFELEKLSADRVKLCHVIEMRTVGVALLQWYFAIKPLHDALLEDALDRAELFAGGKPRNREWSLWVRFLRWAKTLAGAGRTRSTAD